MPRMRILNCSEQSLFDMPPEFNSELRKKYFFFPKELCDYARNLRNASSRIGFLLSCGYFNASHNFYSNHDFYSRDIEYVKGVLQESDEFKPEEYSKSTRSRHELYILEYYGFKRFSKESEEFFYKEIELMVREQLKPKLIFWRCVDLINRHKTELPSSFKLTELITEAFNQRKNALELIIRNTLTVDERNLLDQLFIQDTPSQTASYRLTLLKKISQSTKPTKVRERVSDLSYLSEMYKLLTPVISALDLKHEGIRYFAGSVIKSQILQLRQRSDEGRYIHVIAFIVHQYFGYQDNLVDVLLTVVRTFQNSTQREHKDQCYDQRKSSNEKLSSLLDELDDNVFSLLRNLR